MNLIPLALAMLCCSCEVVSRFDEAANCPSCGSEMVMPLATWLPTAEGSEAK